MHDPLEQTKAVISALSFDSYADQDPAIISQVLNTLYAPRMERVTKAIESLLADPEWSQDRQPYDYLTDLLGALS